MSLQTMVMKKRSTTSKAEGLDARSWESRKGSTN